MTPSLLRQTTWTALMGAALLLGACVTSEEGAGVDPEFADANIDARVAGNTLAGVFAQGKEWNGAPMGLQALGALSAGAMDKSGALPKRADIGVSIKVDLSDTAKGYAMIYSETGLLLVDIRDTARIKWDEKARDDIKDNENALSFKRVRTTAGGRVETIVITDADGDGQVTALPGRDNRARLVVTVSDQGALEKTVLLVGAGPDADFDAEGDNAILEASWTKTQGARTEAVTFRNRKGGKEILRGDTLIVHLEATTASAQDTLARATLDLVMNPGQDLKSDADDSCYAFRIATEKRLGLERKAEFNFISDRPIPHGQLPVSGSFSGSATYANGKSAALEGSFSPTGFTAEFKGPDGNTAKVAFTLTGEVVTAP